MKTFLHTKAKDCFLLCDVSQPDAAQLLKTMVRYSFFPTVFFSCSNRRSLCHLAHSICCSESLLFFCLKPIWHPSLTWFIFLLGLSFLISTCFSSFHEFHAHIMCLQVLPILCSLKFLSFLKPYSCLNMQWHIADILGHTCCFLNSTSSFVVLLKAFLPR